MKGKLGSSRKKKTIALIATIAVLLTGAVTGVSLFLKDDGSASAAEMEQVQNPGQIQEPVQSGEQNPEQEPNMPNENPGDGQQEPGEEQPGQTGVGEQTTRTKSRNNSW